MRDLKKLRNLIVIVFIFLVINFVTLKDFSSEDEKPMIVLKEYYYHSFGDIEIRDPRDLNGTQLKEFKFEKVDIKSRKLYRFIGKNNTDYEIYLGDVFVNKSKKTADLELITFKKYESLDEITFEEIEKILYNEEVIELRERAFKKFIGEGIRNNRGGTGNYYKLPLIYCMVENCDIGEGEDKKILTWNEEFKNERNIMEGPYSVQNEKGQIIVWRTLEDYNIYGGNSITVDDFLYIINAYERGSSYGGGFNVDRTFMRGTINKLIDVFSKRPERNIETFEKRYNHFIQKINSIIEDSLAKWSVIPFLWVRYKNYMLFHEETRDFFAITSGIYPEDTRTEFEYGFIKEFETEKNSVRELINFQIDYTYNKIKQSHENYERRVIEKYKFQMSNFDSIYFSIATIWGIIIGLITFFWKISHKFWLGNRKKKKIAHFTTLIRLVIVAIIFFVVYILLYDIFVIHNVNIEESSILIIGTEKKLALLFSLIAAVSCLLWSFRDQIIKLYRYLEDRGYF